MKMSAILPRRGRVRSEARYLQSNDAAATKVVGTVQSLAVVASASRFSGQTCARAAGHEFCCLLQRFRLFTRDKTL